MSELSERMVRDMQLRRLADRTQEAYLYGVRSLAKHCAVQFKMKHPWPQFC